MCTRKHDLPNVLSFQGDWMSCCAPPGCLTVPTSWQVRLSTLVSESLHRTRVHLAVKLFARDIPPKCPSTADCFQTVWSWPKRTATVQICDPEPPSHQHYIAICDPEPPSHQHYIAIYDPEPPSDQHYIAICDPEPPSQLNFLWTFFLMQYFFRCARICF